MLGVLRLCFAGLMLLGGPTSALAAAHCQSPELWGKAWLAASPASGGAKAAAAQAWIWPHSDAADASAWQPVAPETCLSLPADAGAVVYTPRLVQALAQGTGGSWAQQVLFRLGAQRLGEARLQLQHSQAERLEGRGQMAWPRPHTGPLTALGPAQPTTRPACVPADAVGFVAASISPGRAWQQLEALAGGLWPLEATLIGTQITAWEQGLGHGQLAADIFGYSSVVCSLVLMPGGRGHRPTAALMVPVQQPQVALGFVRWALEIVSGLAPSLQVRTQRLQGQNMLAVRGLLASRIYIAANERALFVATAPPSVLALQQAAAAPSPSAPLAAEAPPTAVVFGSIEHAALATCVGERRRAALWLDALNLEPRGRTLAFADTAPDACTWQTSSTRQAR